MGKRLHLIEVGMCCMAAAFVMTFASGCSEGAGSPKAVVKMSVARNLTNAKTKIWDEHGYKQWKAYKEMSDTLSFEKVEKNEDNDCAVVFFTYKEDGKDKYESQICKRSKDTPWVACGESGLTEANNFKENMKKLMNDWEKKNN